MKILLDVPQFLPRPLGMQVYTEHVIKAILEVAPRNWQFIVQTIAWRQRDSHLARLSKIDGNNRAKSVCLPVPGRVYENLLRSDFANFSRLLFRADVVHSFGWRPLPDLKAPVVVTIQDVIPLRLQEGSPEFIEKTRKLLSGLLKQADAVVTISEFSCREIADLFDVDPARIDVIHDGVDCRYYKPLAVDEIVSERAKLNQFGLANVPYFLHKGGNIKRKNKANLIRAFDSFKRHHKTAHKLVLSGADKLDQEAEEALSKTSYAGDILNVGYLSNADSLRLVQLADALVFPSFYEGFGLPPLEAMACGVPVASSHAAALPEVGGDAVLYFDPLDYDGMSEAMFRLVSDANVRQKCIDSGLQRSRKMSWERNAEQTLKVYERVSQLRSLKTKASTCV